MRCSPLPLQARVPSTHCRGKKIAPSVCCEQHGHSGFLLGPRRLLMFEIRFALLDKGGHTLFLVVSGKQGVKVAALGKHSFA